MPSTAFEQSRCSPRIGCCASRDAAQPPRVARRDGLDDGAVLAIHAHRLHEVEPARLSFAARDARCAFAPRYCSKKTEQQTELRIAGGLADHTMEGEVFSCTVLSCRRSRGKSMALQCAPQRRDLAACCALGRERGDL